MKSQLRNPPQVQSSDAGVMTRFQQDFPCRVGPWPTIRGSAGALRRAQDTASPSRFLPGGSGTRPTSGNHIKWKEFCDVRVNSDLPRVRVSQNGSCIEPIFLRFSSKTRRFLYFFAFPITETSSIPLPVPRFLEYFLSTGLFQCS